MKLGFWRAGFLGVALALLAVGWLLAAAASWKQTRLARLAEEAGGSPGLQVAERGEGFPVLVVHGAPGGFDQGLAVAEGLGLEGFRILSPSRPGFLATPLGTHLAPWQQADQLADWLEQNGFGRVGVLGFSSGTAVALHLAARHPEKVAALAIVSGIVGPLPPINEAGEPPLPMQILHRLGGDVGSAIYAWLLEKNFGEAVRLSLPIWYAGSAEDARSLAEYIVANSQAAEAFRLVAESVLPISPRESGTHNDLLLMRMNITPPLPPQNLPTLFLHGTEDPYAPLRAVKEFATKAPHARFATVEKGGHILWVGPDGARAAQIIKDFFEAAAASAEPAPAN